MRVRFPSPAPSFQSIHAFAGSMRPKILVARLSRKV
jgi:hypothetical protein